MHRLLIGAGGVAVALGVGLARLDSWGKFVVVAGAVLLGAGLVLAFWRHSAHRPIGNGAWSAWALLTGGAVGWCSGLALKAVPSIISGDGYEIRDPLVVLSGLGLVTGALVALAVVLGRFTAATK